MGKKAKEHRKKVAARNQKINAEQKKMQKVYQEMFNKQMEELQEKMKINSNAGEIPFEVVSEVESGAEIKL
jgi:predicted metal-dependent peptidase